MRQRRPVGQTTVARVASDLLASGRETHAPGPSDFQHGPLTVDLAPVTDGDDQNDDALCFDPADDSIVADAIPPQA